MSEKMSYLEELDAETLKDELICFLQEEEMDEFTEEFVKFISEDLSRGDI